MIPTAILITGIVLGGIMIFIIRFSEQSQEGKTRCVIAALVGIIGVLVLILSWLNIWPFDE